MPNRVLLSLLLTGCLPATASEWDKRFSWNACDLRVDAGDGAIVVHQGAGNQIEASVQTTGWQIGPSEVQVVDRQSGDHVDLELRVPRLRWSAGHRSIRIEVRVPAGSRTNLHTSDGSLTVGGGKGDTRLRSGDGPIRVDGGDGTVDASTRDGSIRGDPRLHT